MEILASLISVLGSASSFTAPNLTNNNSDISVLFKEQIAPVLVNNNSDISVTFKEV